MKHVLFKLILCKNINKWKGLAVNQSGKSLFSIFDNSSCLFTYLYDTHKQYKSNQNSSSMMLNKEQGSLRIINNDHSSIINALQLSNPPTLTALYNDHLYALFFMIYFCGEHDHKQSAALKISQARAFYHQKLQLHSRSCLVCFNGTGLKRTEEKCQRAAINSMKIKLLQFLESEVSKRCSENQLKFHPANQREILKRAFILLFEKQEKLQNLSDVNFLMLTKMIAEISDIKCKVRHYYHTIIVQLISSVYSFKNIQFFIQLNKDHQGSQTYHYIKRYKLDQGTANELNLSQDNGTKNSNLENYGFDMYGNESIMQLLKVETSMEVGQHQIAEFNSQFQKSDKDIDAQSKIIENSVVNEVSPYESEVYEESQVIGNGSSCSDTYQINIKENEINHENSLPNQKGTSYMQIPSRRQDEFVEQQSVVIDGELKKILQDNTNENESNSETSNKEEKEKMNEKGNLGSDIICSLRNMEPNIVQDKNKIALTSQSDEDGKKFQKFDSQNLQIKKVQETKQNKRSISALQNLFRSQITVSTHQAEPKKIRQRRNSLTQKIAFFNDQLTFESFKNTLTKQQETETKQKVQDQSEQVCSMMHSQTFPFQIINENCFQVQEQDDEIDELLRSVFHVSNQSHRSIQFQLFNKFSFDQLIQILDKIQEDPRMLNSRGEKPSQLPNDQIISILQVTVKQQKLEQVSSLIQKAKQRIKAMRMKLSRSRKEKQKQKISKRGTELIRYPEQSSNQVMKWSRKKQEQVMISNILSLKGIKDSHNHKEILGESQVHQSLIVSMLKHKDGDVNNFKYFSPKLGKF